MSRPLRPIEEGLVFERCSLLATGPKETRFDTRKALTAAALAAIGLGMMRLSTPRRGSTSLIGGIALLVGLVLALAVIGKFVLGPLDAAARYRRRPTQFTMADFLALVFLFQLPVALLRLALPGDLPQIKFLYFFVWTASSLMWGLSVQTLSRAGVETPLRRVVFLSAVLPVVYFGSIVFLGAILLAAFTLVFDPGLAELRGFWWYMVLGALLPLAFAWAARFVRSTLADSQLA